MRGKDIEKQHHKTFEELKHLTDDNAEFWHARDLQVALDYSSWDKFKRVILKAIAACENSGQEPGNHFSQAVKMVKLGSGSQREIEDYQLSRYACYLIVQNGDPSKPVIAITLPAHDKCLMMSAELKSNAPCTSLHATHKHLTHNTPKALGVLCYGE